MFDSLVRFSVRQPIRVFAVALLVVWLGSLAVVHLPVEQTPDVAPPTLIVSARCAGAGAEQISQTVGAAVESQLEGLEGLVSMSSKSTDEGAYELTLTFQHGTELPLATARVQNHLGAVMSQLPEPVRREGFRTEQRPTDILLLVHLFFPRDSHNGSCLDHVVIERFRDAVKPVPGVAMVDVWGATNRSTNVRLDTAKLAACGLTPDRVVETLREHVTEVTVGRVQMASATDGLARQYMVSIPHGSTTLSACEDLVLKTSESGDAVRLGDVAQLQPSTEPADCEVTVNRLPTVGLAVYQVAGANAIDVARQIRVALRQVSQQFVENVDYAIKYDTTTAPRAAVRRMVGILGLVTVVMLLVVFVFRQNVRAMLAPLLATAVVLCGTFVVLFVFGFAINTMTLLGMLLAVGLVADDACTVSRRTLQGIQEELLPPGEAAEQALRELAAPLTVNAVVCAGVCLSSFLLSGVQGLLLQPFAVTLASAAGLSWLACFTVTPALCGAVLQGVSQETAGVAGAVNRTIGATASLHRVFAAMLGRRMLVALPLFGLLLAVTAIGLVQLPCVLLPEEDPGYLIVDTQLPDGCAREEMQKTLERVEGVVRRQWAVNNVVSVLGYSDCDKAMRLNQATSYVLLKPWKERWGTNSQLTSIKRALQMQLTDLTNAECSIHVAPPVRGLGNVLGFDLHLQDIGGVGPLRLQTVSDGLVQLANVQPGLEQVQCNYRADVPRYNLQVDRQTAKKLGISLTNLTETLQAFLGVVQENSLVVLDGQMPFLLQAECPTTGGMECLQTYSLVTPTGSRIPLSVILQVRETVGPSVVYRYDNRRAATLSGQPIPSFGLAHAINAIEATAQRSLPTPTAFAFSGAAATYREDSRWAIMVVAAVVAVVYLILVVDLRSWVLPLVVILSVPIALLGAVVALWIRAYDADIYTFAGFVLLAGLACRSSIHILTLAKQYRADGRLAVEAATDAVQECYPLILMTACVLTLAMVPLMIAGGAGGAALRSISTAIFGGMIAATAQAVWFVSVLFVVTQACDEALQRSREIPVREMWDSLQLRAFLRDALANLHLSPSGNSTRLVPNRIYTVTGPIAPTKLHTTLTHEHVLTDCTEDARNDERHYEIQQVLGRMRDVLDRYRLSNGRALVDCTPAYQGRDPELLARLSRATGILVLTNTGYSGVMDGKFLPRHVYEETVDQLAARWITEARNGIGDTKIRPGFIKIGVGATALSTIEQRLVRAAARAHLETGLTIVSDTPDGPAAIEQLAILEEEGVHPEAWVWAHAQDESNVKLILQAARRGAWVSFDGVASDSISQHVRLVQLLNSRDMLERVLVSHNESGYQVGKPRGGSIQGYCMIFKQFLSALFKVGLEVKDVEQLTVINPMHAFTVRIRTWTESQGKRTKREKQVR